MAITRRALGRGLLASALSYDPLREIARILQNAANPGWFTSPEIAGSVLEVRQGAERFTRAFGTAPAPDAMFPISSITKPMVATAVMVLSDRGQLTLQDRATKFLPEFRGDAREEVTIQHLLTHTSGLPDSLHNTHELLQGQAPLATFFAEACKAPLLFRPGTAFSYSNLGVLLAKEILERLTSVPLRVFLKKEVFDPLSMSATSLGLGGRKLESIVKHQPRAGGLDLNSLYMRDLGTPWGGVHSTAADLTRFLDYFVNPAGPPLRRETALAMLRNRDEGLNQPWGIGWMLARSHDVYYRVRPSWRRYGWSALLSNPETLPAFGVNSSSATFGHYGVSGSLAWADPERGTSLVLLTTREVAHSRDGVFGKISDAVSLGTL